MKSENSDMYCQNKTSQLKLSRDPNQARISIKIFLHYVLEGNSSLCNELVPKFLSIRVYKAHVIPVTRSIPEVCPRELSGIIFFEYSFALPRATEFTIAWISSSQRHS